MSYEIKKPYTKTTIPSKTGIQSEVIKTPK